MKIGYAQNIIAALKRFMINCMLARFRFKLSKPRLSLLRLMSLDFFGMMFMM